MQPVRHREALDQIAAGLGELLGWRSAVRLPWAATTRSPCLPFAQATVAGPVALVHFDAHLDTWDTYFGAPYTHGTPFRRASEEGLIVKGRSAHVGIRGSLYDRRDLLDDDELGFTVVHCRDIERLGVDGVLSSGSSNGSATTRSTSPSTSMCSTRRSRRRPAPPRPAG